MPSYRGMRFWGVLSFKRFDLPALVLEVVANTSPLYSHFTRFTLVECLLLLLHEVGELM